MSPPIQTGSEGEEPSNAVLAVHLEYIRSKVDRLDRAITGGSEPTTGLTHRVGELERKQRNDDRRTKQYRGLVWGSIAAGLISLASAFGHKVASLFTFTPPHGGN